MSNAAASSSSEIRFGAFEVDAHASELRKSGIRIPLQQQPFRVLAFLIDRAGDVVTREELRRKLWPGDTYVDFEHGLNVAIARGREALGDDAESPRFIETLPKRGYRFITPVQRPVDGARERARVRRRRFAWATATLLLAAGATVGVIQRRRPPVLTDRDTILVADFVNKTGEEVFDDTLRQALTVYLEQSPFLSILSRNRVRETLKLMTQAPDSRVLGPVAREVCQRAGARVSIDGHIAALGRDYLVGLEAVDCNTGQSVANAQASAPVREQVLKALAQATSQLRPKLGESAAILKRFNVPLDQVTTGSLEALRAYTAGHEEWLRGVDDPIPFFERAVALDPNFAAAYAQLASMYWNGGATEKAIPYARKAHALRDRVSERERALIDVVNCFDSADQDDCLTPVWRVQNQTYPRSVAPYSNPSAILRRQGKFEQAAAYAREAVRLDPRNTMGHGSLIFALMSLNAFSEAARVTRQAIDRVDLPDWHETLFQIAFVGNDRQAMAVEHDRIESFGESFRSETRQLDADVAAFQGRLTESRSLRASISRLAFYAKIDARLRQRALEALYDAAVGDRRRAMATLSAISGSAAGQSFEADLMIVAAALADNRSLVRALVAAAGPLGNPRLQAVARAWLNIEPGNREKAIRMPVESPSELGTMAPGHRIVFLRGMAYLSVRNPRHAALEFQRIIDHRGVEPLSPLYPLAYVQQARAYGLVGEIEKARKDYHAFFELWKDADADVPILVQAKAEYARLR